MWLGYGGRDGSSAEGKEWPLSGHYTGRSSTATEGKGNYLKLKILKIHTFVLILKSK